MSKGRAKSNEMFDGLVKNAIDFLRRSISELEASPKYSLINFFAAIELFLKARLMLEHWSLIIEDPQNANLTNFHNGDFKSVGMDETIRRLKNVANVKVTEQERETFNQIREHRNKLIHFFHPKHVGEPDSATLQSVVAEQCKGWFYLHRLLAERWRSEFGDYLNEIESLHMLMRKQRGFLQAKFDDIRPSIEKGKERGIVFATCCYCGYESCKQEEVISGSLIVDKCLVCEERLRKLKTPCPSCNNDILALELGEGKCDKCGTQINIDYLIDKYAEHQKPKDYSIEPRRAYCSDCEYTQQPTVVPFGSKWLCLYCLTSSEEYEVRHCGWCGELVTGETGDNDSSGCVMCGVHIERDADLMEKQET